MGEYAHDAMREENLRLHGFDVGEYDDTPKKHQPKPVYKRVKCPHCDVRPKERGLWQHMRDVHGISQVEQALAPATDVWDIINKDLQQIVDDASCGEGRWAESLCTRLEAAIVNLNDALAKLNAKGK